MRLRLFKPLFKLFNLSESRISLNSCWVEVSLKNLQHLGNKGGAFNTKALVSGSNKSLFRSEYSPQAPHLQLKHPTSRPLC